MKTNYTWNESEEVTIKINSSVKLGTKEFPTSWEIFESTNSIKLTKSENSFTYIIPQNDSEFNKVYNFELIQDASNKSIKFTINQSCNELSDNRSSISNPIIISSIPGTESNSSIKVKYPIIVPNLPYTLTGFNYDSNLFTLTRSESELELSYQNINSILGKFSKITYTFDNGFTTESDVYLRSNINNPAFNSINNSKLEEELKELDKYKFEVSTDSEVLSIQGSNTINSFDLIPEDSHNLIIGFDSLIESKSIKITSTNGNDKVNWKILYIDLCKNFQLIREEGSLKVINLVDNKSESPLSGRLTLIQEDTFSIINIYLVPNWSKSKLGIYNGIDDYKGIKYFNSGEFSLITNYSAIIKPDSIELLPESEWYTNSKVLEVSSNNIKLQSTSNISVEKIIKEYPTYKRTFNCFIK